MEERRHSSTDRPSQQQVQRVIQQGGKLLVEMAEMLGQRLQQGRLTVSQIRNVYGMVKQMEMRGFDANEFVLLKPRLAYAAVRANTDGARELKDVLSWAIDEVDEDASSNSRRPVKASIHRAVQLVFS